MIVAFAAGSMMGSVVFVSHPSENEQALLVASVAALAAVAFMLQVMYIYRTQISVGLKKKKKKRNTEAGVQFESHRASVILLEPERLHLKPQFVVLGPRQELRAGASQLTVKQAPERNTKASDKTQLSHPNKLGFLHFCGQMHSNLYASNVSV